MTLQRSWLHPFASAAFVVALALSIPAHADTTAVTPTLSLQKALATPMATPFYKDRSHSGAFALSSSFYSGTVTGNIGLAPQLNELSFDDSLRFDHGAELEGNQRVYALLIDGSYDFVRDNDAQGLRPYLAGGIGMAVYGKPGSSASMNSQGGDMVPLFRLGGGVAYRLGSQWDLSLAYHAGFTALTPASDQVFTGRGQEPVNLHMLNMGVRYQF